MMKYCKLVLLFLVNRVLLLVSGLASGAGGPGNTYFNGFNPRDPNPDQVRSD